MTSEDAASWEAMSMRQLRTECKSRGIDVVGCFEKQEFIRRLRAHAGLPAEGADAAGGSCQQPSTTQEAPADTAASRGSSVAPGASGGKFSRRCASVPARRIKESSARGVDAAATSRADDVPNGKDHAPQQAEAAPGSGGPAADSFEGMSTRELRKLCEARGIDFHTCTDKADVISRLRAKAQEVPAPPPPAGEAAAAEGAGEAAVPGMAELLAQLDGDEATNADASADIGTDRVDEHVEEAQTPGAPPAARPAAADVRREHAAPTAVDVGRADEAQPAKQSPIEVGAQPAAVAGARSGVLINGRPAELVSVRQLRQECQAMGIDIVGCFAKSEIISRIRDHQAADKPEPPTNGAAPQGGQGQQATADEPPVGTDSQRGADESQADTKKTTPLHEVGGEAPPPEGKSAAGAELSADGKRWETMNMRQLKKECEDRGIDLTGCFSKLEVIRRLHAASEPPRQQVANPNEPDTQEIADPPAAASEAEVWQAMSTRELRTECELHGIDVLSCHDKADIIRRLRESRAAGQALLGRAARVDVADKASQAESEPVAPATSKDVAQPADAKTADTSARQPPVEHRTAPGAEAASSSPGEVGPATAAETTGAQEVTLECGKRVALSAPSISSLSARELRRECDALRVDLDGCLDRADIVERLLPALEAKAKEAVIDKQGTQPSPEEKSGGLASAEVRKAPEEPAVAAADAGGSPTGEEAWAALSIRQLKSECKARGIDVTACYDKDDIIGRLRAASRQAQAEAAPNPDAKAAPLTRRLPAARARLSISDLYKLSVEELRQKCLEEGVSAQPEEPRGALISRLRQSHAKAASFANPVVARARELRAAARARVTTPVAKAAPSAPDVGTSGTSSAEPSSTSSAQEAAASRAERRDTAPAPAPAGSASPRGGSSAAGAAAAGPEAVAGGGGAETSEERKEEAAAAPAPASTPVEPEQPAERAPRKDADAAGAGPSREADAGGDASPSAPGGSFFDFDDLPDDATQGPPGASKAAAAAAAQPDVAKNEAATTQEENWEDKKPSELKRECQRRGIDLHGCFDKGEYIRRLQAAAKSGASGTPSVGAAAPPEPASPTKTTRAEQKQQSEPQTTQPSVTPSAASAGQSSPTIDTSAPPTTPPPAASSTPSGWGGYGVKELLKMAKDKGIDTSGCCEKSDIIERLERGPVKTTPMKAQRGSTQRAKSAAAPRTSTTSTASKPPAKGASTLPGRSSGLSNEKEAFPGWRSPAPPTAKAKAAPEPPEPPKDESHRSPSGKLSWSNRVRRYFECYPGFTAILPPEAETWTDQQLEVYFGSNGEIWPAGKRPSWMGRPFEDQDPPPQVPKKKQYPDLKVHFETLDLVETTPPEMIRRHYRRLAREYHPDKNPDDPEGAAERFRKIQTAYEAISDRMHL